MKFVCNCLLMFFLAIGLVACNRPKPEKPVNYSKIMYKNVAPFAHSVNPSVASYNIPALKRVIDLSYRVSPGDTLNVHILEFKSDVYAMDHYMNSGKFQGITPILRGEHLEQSIRADCHIFIFSHDSFRQYERSDLETFVRHFPGYRGGFPQEFLSLPFEFREAGRTSIQTKYFMGVKAFFPVLVQSYRNADLRWNVARSWEQVEEQDFDSWALLLNRVEPEGIEPESDVVYFDAGNRGNGMAQQLAGGRVAVVWGYLSWADLAKKFKMASDRIYEARF
ncbi:MAG: hypothetical protein II892_08480 [Fibrobacter sp.]|jgi:hypothetical protein|nr:hypothetical protein [Fibrobacter sp.]